MSYDDSRDSESLKDKVSNKFEELKESEKFESLVEFAKSNTKDVVAYIVLFVGILFTLFGSRWIGGGFIGIVTGLYFGPNLYQFYQDLDSFIEREGIFKTFVLAGALLGLFISIPFLFIGIAISMGVISLISTSSFTSPSLSEKKKKEKDDLEEL